MKKTLITILFITLTAVTLSSCSGPKNIPTEKMQAIITETLIADAVLVQERREAVNINSHALDSVDIYAPILRKHGYTLDDFRHTVREMAIRKSNPLDNILQNVLKDIERQNGIVSARYRRLQQYDSLIMKIYTDTVYKFSDTIRGSLERFTISVKPAPRGEYALKLAYMASENPDAKSKSIRYQSVRKGEQPSLSSIWLSRRQAVSSIDRKIMVDKDSDTLKIWFHEYDNSVNNLKKRKKPVADTSWIANISIVHTPPKLVLRKRYYNEQTGFDKLSPDYYIKLFNNEENSITIPFAPQEPTDPRLRSSVKRGRDYYLGGDKCF